MIELKSGVRIPESAIVQQITASLDGTYVSGPLSLVQYDDTMPVVAVQLTTNQQPYIPGESAELNYRMGKPWPDTHAVYNPCLGVDEDGVVYFSVTLQGTTTPGETTLTVEVTDGGVKNSAPIRVLIARNPVQEGQIESEDEFLTLQEILAQCQKYGQIVEANAANIQTVVDEMDAIKDAPAAAERAEAAAAEAEKFAAESKGFRTFHGAVVPDSNGNLDPSRPMTVGPAASVEIESAGDRIQSVTALGFTTQAGSGDPSPSNVRQLTNGGLKLAKIVITGDETFGGSDNAYCNIALSVTPTNTGSGGSAYCNKLPYQYNAQAMAFYLTNGPSYYIVLGKPFMQLSDGTVQGTKAYCKQLYESGDPLIVWVFPADESDATGLYAPILLTSGEYRATCMPLTAPLCEGDSVVSWVKSGCDQQLTLDGSTLTVAASGSNYTVVAANAVAGGTVYASRLAGLSLTAGSITIPGTAFPASVTNAGQANTWLQSNPQTLYYQSTAYTEADDIAVSLETHVRAVRVFDGTENFTYQSSNKSIYINMPDAKNGQGGELLCSAFKGAHSGEGYICNINDSKNLFFIGNFDSLESATDTLKSLNASGTPVTIVYQLATPITYAHPAVVLEATTGDQLTYTVTGQSGGTVSVTLKPFQDGGNAKRLDGHTWDEVPGQAPVQSVNGKTGAVTLAATDVGALPATGTAQKANALVGGGVGTQYTFGAYEMQCHNNSEIPNAYSLKSIFRSDANYHLQVYSKANSSLQKTYCDFAGAVSGSSSIRFKADVRPVNGDVLDALLALDVIDFVYNDKAPDYSQDGLRHFGLIAEQVVKVLPNAVKMDVEGLPAAVVYSDLIPLLLAILQRQQKQIDELRGKLEGA